MLETPVIIKVPSVYSCLLPGGEWINLALVRQIKPGDGPGKIVVIWETGEFDVYFGAEAAAILAALKEAVHIDKSEVGLDYDE
jgi:hypothetical protein